jgi:hypothetical protein
LKSLEIPLVPKDENSPNTTQIRPIEVFFSANIKEKSMHGWETDSKEKLKLFDINYWSNLMGS